LLQIDKEHPEYAAKATLWKTYRDLYVGGEQLRKNADLYLVRRQKEPMEVYGERLSRVFYENYIGSIIDWYVATLFRREPRLVADGDDHAAKSFMQSFAEDCDWKGNTITEFFRNQLLEALITGESYTLVDFPRRLERADSRGEEDHSGASRAYLSGVPSEQLINWNMDEAGNFDWVVLRCSSRRKPTVEHADWITETTWMYYDRTSFRKYWRREMSPNKGSIELVDSGIHGLAKLGIVPLFPFSLQQGLWLMNRAGLLQLEHFNKSNGLAWALTMGLFATPVVYSEREWNQIVGESYYIQLAPGDRFGWTEPEGKVFQIAADNLNRLQKEIYRVCYLLTQAGGPLPNAQQSGVSKLRDFAITQEILRAYGDAVKEVIKKVLRAVISARDDKIAVDVSGLDEFDVGDFSSDLEDAERLLNIGIASPTLRKQVFKKLAYKFLSDVRQEIKEQIAREIDEQLN